MSKRLPESRLLAQRAFAGEAAERMFQRPVSKVEIISQGAEKRGTQNKLYSLHIGESVPLTTRSISEWPKTTKALCLHCAEPCNSPPLPAVKYYDSQEQKFWVYGFFCRPCCVLAFVQEHPHTDTTRCLMWSQSILKKYFGAGKMDSAPPRSALIKFGGKLTLEQFYGDDSGASHFKGLHTPPFVTFAMYAELSHSITDPPIDEKKLTGLRRPLVRTSTVAEQDSTEKQPLILEFLAKRGLQKTQAPAIVVPKILVASEPKKAKITLKNNQNPLQQQHQGDSGGGGGGNLSKYIIRG